MSKCCPVVYYTDSRTAKIKFAVIKGKGVDGLRVMNGLDTYFAGLPSSYRSLVIRLSRCWGAVWFLISTPWLLEKFFPDLLLGERRQAAEDAVRKLSAEISELLHGLFGGGPWRNQATIWTPTIHTAVYDMPYYFCDRHEDTWFWNEHAVEHAQQENREVDRGQALHAETKNHDSLVRIVS